MSETFVIQIKNSQNASWQGTVAWSEGKEKKAFRSELELIRLINSALAEKEPDKDSEDAPEKE